MSFLASVYYPTEQERKEMTEAVKEEAKMFKAAGIKFPADRGFTHGQLLLALGRLWRSNPHIKAWIRAAYGLKQGGNKPTGKAFPEGKDRASKRPLNVKSSR
jgi:hypothetical protein